MSLKTHAPIKRTTYLECLDLIPPNYCRLIARENKRGGWARILSIPEIAKAGGLTWQRAAAIARRKSFAGVTVEDADKFRLGCGITLRNERIHIAFLKRNFNREKSFERNFSWSRKKWPYRSWRTKFMDRILKRL